MHNILRFADVRRALNAQAAGSTAVKGITIDMLGYDGVAFAVLFGALTATQVTSIKVQQSDTTTDGDFVDLADSASPALADGDGNKLLLTEVYRPKKRYVRVYVSRGTANAVIDGAVAILHRAELTPPAPHSSVAAAPVILNSPAEGAA